MFPLLPLRIPVDCDLVLQLSNWINERHETATATTWNGVQQQQAAMTNNHGQPATAAAGNNNNNNTTAMLPLPPTVMECRSDLVRLHELRLNVARVMMMMQQQNNMDQQEQQGVHEMMTILKEYATLLNAFCQQGGFPEMEPGDHHAEKIRQQQQQQQTRNGNHNNNNDRPPLSPMALLEFPWKIIMNSTTNNTNNTNDNSIVTGSSLTWERANVYWNLCALTLVQAKRLHPATTKPAWSEMGTLLQNAACWIQHVRVHVLRCPPQNPNTGDDGAVDENNHHHPSSTTKPHDHDDDNVPGGGSLFGNNCTDDAWLSSSASSSSSSSSASASAHNCSVLYVIESFLSAAAQCVAFEWFQLSKSQHLMSAKLAAASIPFYAMAEEEAHNVIQFLQQQQQQQTTRTGDHNHYSNIVAVMSVLQQWAVALRSWGMWMSAVSEYHQALVHEAKRVAAATTTTTTTTTTSLSVQQRRQQLAQQEEHLSLELARLDIANRFGTLCEENLIDYQARNKNHKNHNDESQFLLGTLVEQVQVVLPQIRAQLVRAQQEGQRFTAENHNNNQQALVIPSHEDLPEIPPQTTVKLNSEPAAMAKLLPLAPSDLFKTTLNASARRMLLDTRLDWEEEWLPALEQQAEEVTEHGRRTLASVNLPHSLTAYRQERAGGGIPLDLWLRVEQLQKENRITRLQQELWDLKDVADQASFLYKGIHSQLQEDLMMDQLFREQNPAFEGHDVEEIQKTFRLTLENYAHLMESAEKGDALLFKRLELLNTDPKYRLLQFRKSQLDRLIPPANMGNINNATQQDINVEELSRYLVELSSLFQKRDDILDALRNEIRVTHAGLVGQMIRAMQQQHQQQQQDPKQPSDDVYHNIVASARRSLEHDMVQGLQDNMKAQSDLLKRILEENAYFCRARGGSSAAAAAMPVSPSSTGDRSILKIEDALEEIDQLDKHLKEGRAFYNVVIPKLEKLQQQVGDVSARLTIDRCDFDDKARRKHQEAEDARMAASMSSSTSPSNNNSNNNTTNNNNIPSNKSSASVGSPHNPPPSGYRIEPSAAARSPGVVEHQRRISDSSNFDAGGSISSGRHNSGHGNPGGGGGGGVVQSVASSLSSSLPSVPLYDEPGVRVDDEKVASLVAMDFDPDKVVAALKKYDNNVEQAINDLLSG